MCLELAFSFTHDTVSFPNASVHILNQLHSSLTVSHVYMILIVKYSVIILSSVACICVGGCICMYVCANVCQCVSACACALEHVYMHVLLYVCFAINNWQYEY